MGSRVVGGDLALMILDAWLSGVYEGGRHQRRVDMIASLEKGISMGNDEIHPV